MNCDIYDGHLFLQRKVGTHFGARGRRSQDRQKYEKPQIKFFRALPFHFGINNANSCHWFKRCKLLSQRPAINDAPTRRVSWGHLIPHLVLFAAPELPSFFAIRLTNNRYFLIDTLELCFPHEIQTSKLFRYARHYMRAVCSLAERPFCAGRYCCTRRCSRKASPWHCG